jgi:predicted GNAT family N-acyltransferase
MDAALQLRYDVFCVEQGVPQREEVDGRDPEGIHLVAVAAGRLLGTCRLLLIGRTVQFSRLAVHPAVRRRGIATALLEAAESEATAAGARRMVLHAQTYARSLYEGAGYRPRGNLFREAGIEHVAMEKELG